jgi:hypothetical protein
LRVLATHLLNGYIGLRLRSPRAARSDLGGSPERSSDAWDRSERYNSTVFELTRPAGEHCIGTSRNSATAFGILDDMLLGLAVHIFARI